jgi:tetratricopeptide (TPR) repeat protein
MQFFDRIFESELAAWRVIGLVVACFVSACSTSNGPGTSTIDIEGGRGFTITEHARFGSGVKSDFEKALQLIEEEQYEDGIELLEEVTEAAPNATAAHLNLGIAHGLVGDWEPAEESIKTALKLSPRHPVALNELGIVYRKTGRFDEARESYEGALAVFPEFHFARRNLAILCDVYMADMACAIEHYELYAEVVPEDEAVAMWIKDLRNRMGK